MKRCRKKKLFSIFFELCYLDQPIRMYYPYNAWCSKFYIFTSKLLGVFVFKIFLQTVSLEINLILSYFGVLFVCVCVCVNEPN